MADSVQAQKKESQLKVKEVLVVFELVDKRKQIKFEVSDDPSKDKSSLLRAVRVAFADVFPDLPATDETSSGTPNYVLQAQPRSSELGDELVAVSGEVPNQSTIFIKRTDDRKFMLEGVQVLAPGNVHLGNSAFTDILELQYRGLKCAGRRIKLNDRSKTQAGINPFQKECEFLSRIRHPNIVQFLGVFFHEGEPAPILVMEFLSTDLTSCIKQYGVLSQEISYSILYNVALGLHYLHSQTPPIIHRDLSSNNILLTPNMTAKISDLGKAKILLENDSVHRPKMTTNPGCVEFMPPEAQMDRPDYNIGIDEFSYGVIMIHTFSGKWPAPHRAPSYTESDGTMKVVSEADRRKDYLDVIGEDHPLMDLIRKCLHNHPKSRAHACEIMERLAEMVEKFPFASQLEMLKQKKNTADQITLPQNVMSESAASQLDGAANVPKMVVTPKQNGGALVHDPATSVGTGTSNGQRDPVVTTVKADEFGNYSDHKDGRISCNEAFKKHLKEYCKFTGRTLIEEDYTDEVFKKAEYDWSGIEFDRGSTVACTPKEKRVGDATEYRNRGEKETEETYSHNVVSTAALEIIKTESTSWNIQGGLSAEYHVGASAGIGYTKQKSKATKHSAGTSSDIQIQRKFTVPPKHSRKVMVIRWFQEKKCQVSNVKISFPKDAKIKCKFYDNRDTKEKSTQLSLKDILKGCSDKDRFIATLEGMYVWMETKLIPKVEDPLPL